MNPVTTKLKVTITVQLDIYDEAALVEQGGNQGVPPRPATTGELAACVGKLTSAKSAVSGIAGIEVTSTSVGVDSAE